MHTVFDDRHAAHRGSEIRGGKLVPSVECPERAELVRAAVAASDLGPLVPPHAPGLDVARRLHAPGLLSFLEGAFDAWRALSDAPEAFPLGWPTATAARDAAPRSVVAGLGRFALAADTPITAGSWRAALGAVDVAASAAALVSAGAPAAFALCRPPGHHAARAHYGGYCYLGNTAVAAQVLRDAGAARVAVLDVDYHHGNGTQELFWERGDVLTLSLHADPDTTFPFYWGRADERGAAAGEGANRNFPLPQGTGFAAWSEALRTALTDVERFRAEALVVALGLDTYRGDPFSTFGVDTDDFRRMGALLRTGLPTVFVLEGGYDLEHLGENAVAVLSGFEG